MTIALRALIAVLINFLSAGAVELAPQRYAQRVIAFRAAMPGSAGLGCFSIRNRELPSSAESAWCSSDRRLDFWIEEWEGRFQAISNRFFLRRRRDDTSEGVRVSFLSSPLLKAAYLRSLFRNILPAGNKCSMPYQSFPAPFLFEILPGAGRGLSFRGTWPPGREFPWCLPVRCVRPVAALLSTAAGAEGF